MKTKYIVRRPEGDKLGSFQSLETARTFARVWSDNDGHYPMRCYIIEDSQDYGHRLVETVKGRSLA